MGNIFSLISGQTTVDERLHDPRSPFSGRARTPLARMTSNKKRAVAALQDLADPRSPTLAFRRTPLVQQDIDYNDPRSPMAGRTPVRRLMFDLHDPREADRVRTPLVSHTRRRLVDDDDDGALNDSVHSALDASTDEVVIDDSDFSMESVLDADAVNDDDDDDDDFEEVDLDAESSDAACTHEKTNSGEWPAHLASVKPTARYVLLSPKHQGTPRLSLCAGAVRGAIARAVQSARTTRHVPVFATPSATPVAALLLRPDDEKALCATPPSPFALLHGAGLAYRPRVSGGARLATSCPSSPAA